MSIELFSILRDLRLPMPQGIIQVGASVGQELDSFLAAGVRCGVCIEPLPAAFGVLSQRCRAIPDYVAVQTLCTDVTGRKYTFNVANNGGMSSSILEPENHLKIYGNITFEETLEVSSVTLDDVLAYLAANGHAGVVSRLDTLYMDTQGAELLVLQGATASLPRVRYIFTEVTRNRLYRGSPSLKDLMEFLDAQGFVLNNIYYNREHWGDAVFLRKEVVGYAE